MVTVETASGPSGEGWPPATDETGHTKGKTLMKIAILFTALFAGVVGLGVQDTRTSTCKQVVDVALSGRHAVYVRCFGGITGFSSDAKFVRYVD